MPIVVKICFDYFLGQLQNCQKRIIHLKTSEDTRSNQFGRQKLTWEQKRLRAKENEWEAIKWKLKWSVISFSHNKKQNNISYIEQQCNDVTMEVKIRTHGYILRLLSLSQCFRFQNIVNYLRKLRSLFSFTPNVQLSPE